jgi:hypothetical protein
VARLWNCITGKKWNRLSAENILNMIGWRAKRRTVALPGTREVSHSREDSQTQIALFVFYILLKAAWVL